MRKIILCALSLIALLVTLPAMAQTWPPLPTQGFVSGRPANEKDVADGNAIFVAKVDNRIIGTPILIAIPQYAYVTDVHLTKGGPQIPVIVVQAEQAADQQLFGVRDFSGHEYVVTAVDVKLLGSRPPQ